MDLAKEEILEQLSVDQEISLKETEDHLTKVYQISTLQSLLGVCGQSKLSQFLKRNTFVSCQVKCLPPFYNGDLIFELPPK
jgi:hypothetical protein